MDDVARVGRRAAVPVELGDVERVAVAAGAAPLAVGMCRGEFELRDTATRRTAERR